MTEPLSVPVSTPSLVRVARGDLCAGCGACAAIAPGRVGIALRDGWLRPIQTGPVSAEEDATIAAVCPGLGQRVVPGNRADDPLWGPWLDMHTGWATDPALRHAAASGGALSALLVHLLESGRVEGVLQVVADPDRPEANAIRVSTTPAEVLAAAGSRYAPSAPLAGLAAHLDTGRRLAFVGKPCDAVALRAWAGRDARVAVAFPVVVSFFCGGVPSQSGTDALLAALGAAREDLQLFRYRGHGWPGRATAVRKDGSETSMSYPDSWGNILSRWVQLRCKICPDGTGAAADIVCADAWETNARGYPLFEDAPGVSLIMARTELGRAVIGAAAEAGRIGMQPFDPAMLPPMQPGQVNRKRAILARLAALRALGRPVPRYRGLRLRDAARQEALSRHLRTFAGTIRRAVRWSGLRR